jgi:hypothetical protein
VIARVLRVGRRRRAAAGIIALATAVAAPSGYSAAEEASARVVRYQDDVLTVRLRNVPIDEVLRDVANQSGAEVRGQVRTRRDVTAEFDAVALPEALSRLLGDQAFALVYGSEGRLRAVRLLGSDGVSVQARRSRVRCRSSSIDMKRSRSPAPSPKPSSRTSRRFASCWI